MMSHRKRNMKRNNFQRFPLFIIRRSKEEQRKYLRDNFTKVELNEEKKKFLEIKWPYVYTLNIDDAIERNSGYENVVYPYRKIYDDIFDQEKCTIIPLGSDPLTIFLKKMDQK